MLGRTGICLVVIALVLLSFSCTRIESWKSPEEGGLAIEKLQETNSIPLKWGNLVQVTLSPWSRDDFHLWYQDQDGNVRIATYSMNTNRLLTDARLIQKK